MVRTLAGCGMRRVRRASKRRSWFTYQTSPTWRPPSGSNACYRIQPEVHFYLPGGDGIALPVFPNNGLERVKLLAHVDTGASHCLFERRHGELLNLDVEAGDPITFRTATGRVEAFGHLVTIETLGLNFESVVYFFADERINKNLLGRLGWLDRIRLGLIDHDGLLYVASYG